MEEYINPQAGKIFMETCDTIISIKRKNIMEEYLKHRHNTLNKELTEATRDKMQAPTLGQEKLAAIKVIELNARLTEINKAQTQLRNETANKKRV